MLAPITRRADHATALFNITRFRGNFRDTYLKANDIFGDGHPCTSSTGYGWTEC
jgi:hypothetical protein